MEIEDTGLWREAQLVMSQGRAHTRARYRVVLLAGEEEVEVLQLVARHVRRDYKNGYADEVSVRLLMGLGTYTWRVYPQRDQLQALVQRLALPSPGDEAGFEEAVQTEYFSAVLCNTNASKTVAQGAETLSEDALNLAQLVEIDFQLYNKAVERLRMTYVGENFLNATPGAAIQALLSREARKIKIDQTRVLHGVDLKRPNHTAAQPQLLIPQGVNLVDVANYIQQQYGVYSTGLGSYIQDEHWWVYPLYDVTRFDEAARTLTLMVLPANKYSEVEHTYWVEGSNVTVLCTGQTSFQDDNGTQALNHGNGVRFADALSLMEQPGEVKDNKVLLRRNRNASEFMLQPRADGLNHASFAAERISANPYLAYSHLAARSGALFRCHWENAEASLIVPGMSAKVYYFHDDAVWSFQAVCLGVEAVLHNAGGLAEARHSSHASLYFYAGTPQREGD